eukprot:7327550-Prymnesium_polylepis.1
MRARPKRTLHAAHIETSLVRLGQFGELGPLLVGRLLPQLRNLLREQRHACGARRRLGDSLTVRASARDRAMCSVRARGRGRDLRPDFLSPAWRGGGRQSRGTPSSASSASSGPFASASRSWLA